MTHSCAPTSVTSGAGDNSLTATQTMTYDPVGDLATVDGPLSGTADTTRYRYNAARERIGVISPDPDSTGGLKHRRSATTVALRPASPQRSENGTSTPVRHHGLGAFAPLDSVETGYDGMRVPHTQKLVAVAWFMR